MLEFQHPKLVDRPPTGADWLHEIKFDGYRVQAHVQGGRVTIYTRNGLDWTERFPSLVAALARLEDCVLDAEVCALGPDGYSSFSALRSAIFKAPETLVLFVFDLLWREYRDLRGYALETRKKALASILEPEGGSLGEQVRFVHEIAGEGPRLLEAACQLQWEGIVSKRRDAPYRAGRADSWVKSKCRPSESIVIGGWVSDNGRFAYLLGGVREDDGSLRYVGSIKGGYGARVATDLWPRIKALAADKSPFRDGPRKTGEIHWLRPELVAEVEFAEFTASGKLRQASFKGLREDL